MKLLTVLMSVFNGEVYLKESIESILGQTFSDFEFLIINDGSTDKSKEILESYLDERIRIINQKNMGLGAALNVGLTLCNTRYIARMDADDISDPGRLYEQIKYLNENSDIAVVGTQFTFIDSSGRIGGKSFLPYCHEQIVTTLKKGVYSLSHATIMCRTEAIRGVGGYRIQGVGEDMDLMLRLTERYSCANLKNSLYYIRIHPSSVCLENSMLIEQGVQYALRMAKLRKLNKAEISYEEYKKKWQKRPVGNKILAFCNNYSAIQYRLSIIERLCGLKVKSFFRLLWACLWSPQKAIIKLQRIVWEKKSQCQ